MIQWILILLLVGVSSLYFYFKHKFRYWSDRGLAGPQPVWFFGTILNAIRSFMHQNEIDRIHTYGKVYGGYFGTHPQLVIADPELVKQMIIRDFHIFVNRLFFNTYHEAWNRAVFAADGADWKRLRTITSSAFSPGKLKSMNALIRKCIDTLDEHLEKVSKEPRALLDVKPTMAGFTVDVIASTSFATDTQAHSGTENPFVKHGRNLFDINPVRVVSCLLFPRWLLNFLGLKHFMNPEPFEFFLGLAKTLVEMRKQGVGVGRMDLTQLLMDASANEEEIHNLDYENMTADERDESKFNQVGNNKSIKLTDTEIIGNMMGFFVAGYETTASALSHCIYELTVNPDIQNRLYSELSKSLEQFHVSSDEYFDTVMNGIPYLKAVIKETLRLYPAFAYINRTCAQDGYQLGPVKLFKGQMVFISIAGIHWNSEYWPVPKKFNPDRFMPENKHKLVPYAYLSFSLGPRNCIAMQFAYQELRLCLARIVLKYRFERTAETPDQLCFKKGMNLLFSQSYKVRVVQR